MCFLFYSNNYSIHDFLEHGIDFNVLHPMERIKSMMTAISSIYHDYHNIILIDEVLPSNEKELENYNYDSFDCSTLDISFKNLDLLMAINPSGRAFGNRFRVIPPKNSNTITQQLLVKHRNSFEIFLILEHWKYITAGNYGFLDSSFDMELDKSNLPSGRLPVWIQVEGNVNCCQVLQIVKDHHVLRNESVTVLYNPGEQGQDLEHWCNQNNWRCLPFFDVYGCEDQCIIIFMNTLMHEYISRARNGLIFVTTHE